MKTPIIALLLAALPVIISGATVPAVRDIPASCNHTASGIPEAWSTLPISDPMKKKCAQSFFCKEASDILFSCYDNHDKFGGGMHECLCGAPDWKTWVLECTACISENLPADAPNDPQGLTAATEGIIGEYCKLPPNLEKPTEELAFYGDMLTTRYWSPIRFFTFITLNAPICSAESVTRHTDLKRAAADPPTWDNCVFGTCNTARSYWKTCFYSWPQAHNSPGGTDYYEHVWNCFCRNQGPETGIGGGFLGPWASACDTCFNTLEHTEFDSNPLIQEYCNGQSDFAQAAIEMISQAALETSQQSPGFNLLNYTVGSPGIPAPEDIPDIPFTDKRAVATDPPSYYDCIFRSPGCSTARSYYKTCFYKWVEAHNGVPNSPEGLEHTWNCFCRNQGPETGIGGGFLGPWGQNASACDECINFHFHANFDSFPIIQNYCDIQTGRFDEAAYEMISQAAYVTYIQGGGANLLNYTLGFPGQPAFEDISDIPF